METENDTGKVCELLRQLDKNVKKIDDFSGEEFETSLTKCIRRAEELTRIVSALSMFSSNESYSELATETISCLLLPAYLGYLNEKRRIIDPAERLELLETSKVYYKDFLKRLDDYGIYEMPKSSQEEYSGESATTDPRECMRQRLEADKKRREVKLQRFQRSKELKTKIESLESRLANNQSVDDEIRRDLYFSRVKSWADQAVESLEAIEDELPLARMRASMKENGDTAQSSHSSSKLERPSSSKTFKPIIITRNEAQKKVFGAGYPSVPTMTLDEWADQLMDKGGYLSSANNGPEASGDADAKEAKDERLVETDDPGHMKTVREWDDYKDDHRRGWGNTHNKG